MTDFTQIIVGIVGGLIAILIGLVLFPVVQEFSDVASLNASAGVASLIGLVPLLWVVAIVFLAVGVIVIGFKTSR